MCQALPRVLHSKRAVFAQRRRPGDDIRRVDGENGEGGEKGRAVIIQFLGGKHSGGKGRGLFALLFIAVLRRFSPGSVFLG